jgi:hypothetical protein
MLILKADNRTLTDNVKFTFLSDNTLSGVSALTVASNSGFAADDYILIEDFSQESAEIVKISSVAGSGTINLSTATIFSHSESSKIRRILYNQVRFYRTTTATFSAGSPLGTVNIDPQSFYTYYEDSVNSSGYGWFIFLNETTTANSAPSNPMPYAGFDANSAKSIIESFLNSLNNSDAKLVSFDQAFRWLSEGYSIAYNELNLANQEYTTAAVYPITIVAGTQEYELPSSFSKLVSVSDGSGADLDYIKQRDIREYLNLNTGSSLLNSRFYEAGSTPRYYIRGNYIGFVPLASVGTTYYIYYNSRAGILSSYYDNVVLPNNNYFCMIDFMMYRASDKITSIDGNNKYKMFMVAINQMKVNSVKTSANRDTWDIDPQSNV